VPEQTVFDLDVVVLRGGVRESSHRVHAAVVDAHGSLVASARDPYLATFWRSCAKPFQVLSFVRAGGLERFGWGSEELALACASHGGEPEHAELAARMLASIGLTEEDLACGVHEPLSARGADLTRSSGQAPTRLQNNCSGKHAAMLAHCALSGWSTGGYERATHPLQKEILRDIARWTDCPEDTIPIAVDGCRVPVFALPLSAMALAYARFADAIARNDGALAQIGRAMQSHPFIVGGTDRFDTLLMQALPGAVIGKVGAEGVYNLALPAHALGVAIKVEDGGRRAHHIPVLGALRLLGVLAEDMPATLVPFASSAVLDSRGDVVGEVALAGVTLDAVSS
jgi:L-asparaginase II